MDDAPKVEQIVEEKTERRLAAIMFTDMVGYTARAQENEALAMELLEEHQNLLRPVFSHFCGREVKTIGDAFLVEYPSALQAAQCGVEIQRVLKERNALVEAAKRIEIRIGIHLGDVVSKGTDVFGDSVNVASRIEPLAGPGGVCLSEDVARLIRNKIDLPLENLGPKKLKDVQQPVEVYRIVLPWSGQRIPPAESGARATRQKHLRTLLRGLGLLLIALLVAAGVAVVTPSVRSRLPSRLELPLLNAEKQLAVLPFTNIGSDPANQSFCDGLVEILSSKLSQLEQFQRALRVVPASDVIREGIRSAREARQVFGVTLVITGSVQRTENRVRLTINLVDPQTLRQLRSQTIDTELRDVSVLQDGVVLEVAGLLDVNLPSQAKQVLMAGGTTVPGAYDFYTQGKGYLQRYEEVGNVDKAIGLFQRALEQDPKYALAHAGLAEAYWRRYEFTKDTQWAEQAKTSCATAIRLNDRLAQVYVILGMTQTGTGQYEDAIRSVNRALELDPINPEAFRELAKAYEGLNNLKEAESTYIKAVAERPSFWGAHNDLGRFYFRFGRYAEAEKEFLRVIALTPDNSRGYSNLGAVYYTRKRYEDAAKMFEKSTAIKPTNFGYSNLGTIYFTLGRYSLAAETFERAIKMNDRDSQSWHNLAAAYQWSNEPEKARAAFQRAAELGEERRQVNTRDPALLMDLADCYSMLGQPQRARDLLQEALALVPEDVDNMFQAAVVYEQLGDRESALKWLAAAIKRGYSRDLIQRSPSLANLRSDPRFQGLSGP